MPRNLSEKERMDWYSAMYLSTQARQWVMGSYNPTAPFARLRNLTAMGRYMEDAAAVITPVFCNCWEAVMLAAIEAQIYDKDEVKYALTPVPHVARSRLIQYMYTNPDRIVNYGGSDPINLPTSSIIMFGSDGSHFALSVGGETVLHVDRQQQGLTSLTAMRSTGYQGQTYYPMYVKRPPIIPGDMP